MPFGIPSVSAVDVLFGAELALLQLLLVAAQVAFAMLLRCGLRAGECGEEPEGGGHDGAEEQRLGVRYNDSAAVRDGAAQEAQHEKHDG